MLILALALACAPHPAPPAAAADAAPTEAAPAPASAAEPAPGEAAPAEPMVSPPVTLEQFRAAFPVGTKIRLRVEMKGMAPLEQRWEWTEADAEGGTLATSVYDADGKLLKDEGAARVTWAELMTHGQFPAAHTTREDSSVDVPAGHFDTWLFTFTDNSLEGVSLIKRFHFAKAMPGPPVLYTIENGGVEVFRMTMLERTQP